MRKVAEILQTEYGATTWLEAIKASMKTMRENPPPRTTSWHISLPYASDDCPDEPPAEELQKAYEENTLHARIRQNYVFRIQNMVYKLGPAQQIIEVSSQDEQLNSGLMTNAQ